MYAYMCLQVWVNPQFVYATFPRYVFKLDLKLVVFSIFLTFLHRYVSERFWLLFNTSLFISQNILQKYL